MTSLKPTPIILVAALVLILLFLFAAAPMIGLFPAASPGRGETTRAVGFLRSVYERESQYYLVFDKVSTNSSGRCADSSSLRAACEDESGPSNLPEGINELLLPRRFIFVSYDNIGQKDMRYYSPSMLKKKLAADPRLQQTPHILSLGATDVRQIEEIYDPLF